MIESVELGIYMIDGNNINMSLSPVQLEAVARILGLEFKSDGTVACFSDNSLKLILERTLNRIIPVDAKN